MGMTKTGNATKAQLHLLRSMAGLETRQARLKPIVDRMCFEKGWTTKPFGGELTEAGKKVIGLTETATSTPLLWENTTATPWG